MATVSMLRVSHKSRTQSDRLTRQEMPGDLDGLMNSGRRSAWVILQMPRYRGIVNGAADAAERRATSHAIRAQPPSGAAAFDIEMAADETRTEIPTRGSTATRAAELMLRLRRGQRNTSD